MWQRAKAVGVGVLSSLLIGTSAASGQSPSAAALVIVQRTATTAPESIQEDYAKLARSLLPKYGAHYLARSRQSILLEGDGEAPCCIAVLQFPSLEAVRRWYSSLENRAAIQARNRGASFRIIAIEALPSQAAP